jgi:hypothetical protein
MRSVPGSALFRRALIVLAGSVVYASMGPVHAAPPAEAPPVELKVVKYKDLEEAVRAQKGKVLVLDVWAEY